MGEYFFIHLCPSKQTFAYHNKKLNATTQRKNEKKLSEFKKTDQLRP